MKPVPSPGHPVVWAVLTILAFPIVLVSSDMLGIKGLWPFIYAILACLGVLVLEALTRGQLWPFEDGFANVLGHPKTGERLIVFVGMLLLVLETAIIFFVATNRSVDPALIRLVINKQCAARFDPVSNAICRYFTEPQQYAVGMHPIDTVEYAIKQHAAQTWFPQDPLVTCAVRRVDQNQTSQTSLVHVDVVHCVSWNLLAAGTLKPLKTQTKSVASSLIKQNNGLYNVIAWSEDPLASSWDTTLGSIAERCRQNVQSLSVTAAVIRVMGAEALVKAQALLER